MSRHFGRIAALTAIALMLTGTGAVLLAPPAGAQLTPGEATELVFIHGYAPETVAMDCGKDFGFNAEGWQGVALDKRVNGKYWGYHHPGYYMSLDRNGDGDFDDTVDGLPEEKGDGNCLSHRLGSASAVAVMAPGGRAYATRNTPIKTLALDFARWFRNEFVTRRLSRTLPRVDVVGHSMGGLIVRSAMKYYWPFFINPLTNTSMLDDVVTAGTPHDGGRYPCDLGTAGCNQQRNDMNHQSSFLAPLNAPSQAVALEANPRVLADFTTVSSGYLQSVFDTTPCPPDANGVPLPNVEVMTGPGTNDHDFATDLISGVAADDDHEWRLCNVRHDHYFWPQPNVPAEAYSASLISRVLDDPEQNL